MRITKAEMAAIVVTLVLMIAAGSFYLGRSTADTGVTMNTVETEPLVSVTAQAPEPEEAMEISEETSLMETVSTQYFEDSENEYPDSISDSAADTAAETESGLLNLNTATAEQLEELPKIGPVLAQRILDYRDEIGGFTSVEELKNVSGIGDKIFASLENLVEVVN